MYIYKYAIKWRVYQKIEIKPDLLIQIKNGIQMLLKKHRKFYIFVFLHGIKGFFYILENMYDNFFTLFLSFNVHIMNGII